MKYEGFMGTLSGSSGALPLRDSTLVTSHQKDASHLEEMDVADWGKSIEGRTNLSADSVFQSATSELPSPTLLKGVNTPPPSEDTFYSANDLHTSSPVIDEETVDLADLLSQLDEVGEEIAAKKSSQVSLPPSSKSLDSSSSELYHPMDDASRTSDVKSGGNVHQVKQESQIQGEKSLRTLGKVEKFFLGIAAKIFPDAKVYLEGRKHEHETLVTGAVKKRVDDSKQQIEAHKEFKGPDKTKGLMVVPGNLFVKSEDLKKGALKVIGHKELHGETAKQAVGTKSHEAVKNISVKGFGEMEAISFDENGVVRGEGVVPTSLQLGDKAKAREDHLTNVYVLHIGNQQAVIRSGKIDTQQRADDFVKLLEDLHEKYAKETGDPNLKMRVVSHQLNSFEKESGFIDGQHRWIADVNRRMGNKAEVIHINTPSNRWYQFTRSLESLGSFGRLVKSVMPKNLFQGEDLSKTQNLDSWGTYSKWAAEDISTVLTGLDSSVDSNLTLGLALSQLNQNQETMQDIKGDIDGLITQAEEIKGKLKGNSKLPKNQRLDEAKVKNLKKQLKEINSRISEDRKVLRDLLIEDHAAFTEVENALAAIESPSAKVTSALETVSLMKQVLGSQLGLEGQVMDRGKENMAIQLLNDKLGVTSALNCKSGLDRTGIWHAVKLGMLLLEKEIANKPVEGMSESQQAEAASRRIFNLVNDWDATTTLMNKLSAHLKGEVLDSYIQDGKSPEESLAAWKEKFGDLLPDMSVEEFKELKQKMSDALDLRKEVLNYLISVGIPITTASTGMMGLKWNSGIQENLIPLNFLPSHVEKSKEPVVTTPKQEPRKILEEQMREMLYLKKDEPANEPTNVPLVKYNKSGEIGGISMWGRMLVTKFQKLRGS